MNQDAKRFLKKAIQPAQKAMVRLVAPHLENRLARLETTVRNQQIRNTLIYKSACLIAADKLEGDYLEFGVYSGGSFSAAYRGPRRGVSHCFHTRPVE